MNIKDTLVCCCLCVKFVARSDGGVGEDTDRQTLMMMTMTMMLMVST